MAPALTQASESPDLTDATRHSLPPKAITNIGSHDQIKILKESQKLTLDSVLTSPLLISNGDCIRPGLAPPACGRAEGRPEPSNSPCQFNMEEFPPVSIGQNSGDQEPPILPENNPPLETNNMGLQSCLRNVSIASDSNFKGSEVVTTMNLPPENSQMMLYNQSDFLSLIGQDFDNVNDIIDTLQSIASNPELLDAAARDLASSHESQSPCTKATLSEDTDSAILNNLIERQHQLERRKNFLSRRLNRIMARGLGVTVSNQFSHLIRHTRAVIEKSQGAKQKRNLRSRATKLESFPRDSMKSMSTSDLIYLVKQVEDSKSIIKSHDSMNQSETDTRLSLPIPLSTEIDTVLSEWKSASLGHVNHDSDATESSSGGESCDENEQFNKANIDYKPIRQRAFYSYCKNRGWIASKWMWLQTQIAEIDNKIQKQEVFHSKLHTDKDIVALQGRRSPADLNMQDPALTCTIASQSTIRTSLNGYHPYSKLEMLNPENECSGSARTAGVHRIKRRRYVDTRRIQKPIDNSSKIITTTHCNCAQPLSCILCSKSTTPQCSTSGMACSLIRCSISDKLCDQKQTFKQKLASIDSSFHPVLSTKPGVLQSETYNKLLRSWDWQQKAFKGKPSILPSSSLDQGDDTDDDEKAYGVPSKRRRKDLRRSNFKRFRDERGLAHRAARRNQGSSLDDDEEELNGGWAVSSSHSSPCPSPVLAKCEKNGGKVESRTTTLRKHFHSSQSVSLPSSSHRIKPSSNSYDINNIVIPCMPAPPKLETIKYKEIPTPKWRIEDIRPLTFSSSLDLEEDMSDEAIMARHCRSEVLERKKFLHYLKFNKVGSSRSSRSRRTDSSGTNTPDHPLSPRALENSPAGSPPGTPNIGPSEDSLPDIAAASSEHQTVLTVSLASFFGKKNDEEDPAIKNPENSTKNPGEDAEMVELSDKNRANLTKNPSEDAEIPTTFVKEPDPGNKPALRTRRIFSGHHDRSLRSASINSVVEDSINDRLSPFPSRDFPMTETDYQVLVTETSSKVDSENVVEVASTHELESVTRDSPLSELTDSAMEEESTWDDESTPPDWTISAVHDHSGGFVLQVQKN